MLHLNNFIIKKLKINSNSKVNTNSFSDEELKEDYRKLINCYSIKDKQPLAIKCGCDSVRVKDIQLAILDKLRENRQLKSEYTKEDIATFLKYDIGDNKLITYLKQETKEFAEALLEYYKNRGKNINPRPSMQTIADKYILKRIAKIQNYLGHQ